MISSGIDSAFAVGVTIYTILDLAAYKENELPVIQYMSFVFTINFLFVPFILYRFGINDYIPGIYQLRIDQASLFSYLIPCMLALIVGLNLFKAKQYQIVNIASIKNVIDLNPGLPRNLMIIGVLAYFAHNFVPSSLEYIFFLLANFRFVSLFLLLLSLKRVPAGYYLLSYGLLIVQMVTTSMFNDFLNLLFFLLFILNIRYKPSWPIKIGAVIAILVLVNTIQSIKFLLREQITGAISNDFLALSNSLDQAEAINADLSFDEKLASNLVRLNEAWVTSSSINFYENNGYELQNGNHLLVLLESALLPRFLAPDKVSSGDSKLFNTYSGHHVDKGTSIALGAPTDGFIDWGYFGWIFMFFYGLIFNLCLRFIYNRAKVFPLLIGFIPIIFYYAVRPDCETQTTLANIFKTTLCVYGFLLLYNRWHSIKIGKKLILKKVLNS